MTDISNTSSKGGVAKASFGAIYMDFCQHITPPLAGYLSLRYPIIGENLSFEIIVFAQATLAAVIIKFTPQHFVQSVTDSIVFVKSAIRQWRDAANKGE